jgi:hypothetical protein
MVFGVSSSSLLVILNLVLISIIEKGVICRITIFELEEK